MRILVSGTVALVLLLVEGAAADPVVYENDFAAWSAAVGNAELIDFEEFNVPSCGDRFDR